MKKNNLIIYAFCLFLLNANSQNLIELNFYADNNGSSVIMDSIKIQNLTQGGEIILPPDVSSYSLLFSTVNDPLISATSKFQNYPNPFSKETFFDLKLSSKNKIAIKVFDLLGKSAGTFTQILNAGRHTFNFKAENAGVYICNVQNGEEVKTIKMYSTTGIPGNGGLTYCGEISGNQQIKNTSNLNDLPFTPGDILLYVAYVGLEESGIFDSPEESSNYTFQFATNIPCIDAATVDYGGQVYNTIQIYSQCWFKENLNVGIQLMAPALQTDNNEIEKYCMLNQAVECENYGGVYMWEELMQYTTDENTQGICPEGWHIPSDNDWKLLEGAVDSQFGIGESIWNSNYERGFDAGKNLKSTSGWHSGGNGIDAFGFTALSGGYYYSGIGWAGGALFGPFYTSSHIEQGTGIKPYHRGLSWMWDKISREFDVKEHARPVRCLKD
jgi:uncharacterized protein (TIGR02145 family)